MVGVKDERMGEEVCACIRLKTGQECTAEELKAYCKGQVRISITLYALSSTCTQVFSIKILLLFSQIAHYKVPRYITFVQGYPLTVTGKVSVIMRNKKHESHCTPPLLLKINNSDDSFSLEKVISVSI